MLKIIPLFLILLSACGSTPDYPCTPAYGCNPTGSSPIVVKDPDPLCRFRKRLTNQQRLERLLSPDYFGVYGRIPKIPYRLEHRQQIQQIQPVQFTQCLLTDSDVQDLLCEQDLKCKQEKHQEMQRAQQATLDSLRAQVEYPQQQQQAQDHSLPECFFFDLFCF